MGISELVTRNFAGRFLLIVCFDSGAITPTEEEARIGWHLVCGGMLSPPLTEHMILPAESCYEWWIFENTHAAERLPRYDYFVNHGMWTLRSPKEIERDYDHTWERGRWGWLSPLQERFWNMVREHRPLAYIADGQQLTIASRDHVFVEAVGRHGA